MRLRFNFKLNYDYSATTKEAASDFQIYVFEALGGGGGEFIRLDASDNGLTIKQTGRGDGGGSFSKIDRLWIECALGSSRTF
jgi:hypothetical protein